MKLAQKKILGILVSIPVAILLVTSCQVSAADQKSDNANLSILVVKASGGEDVALNPAFAEGTLEYAASVTNAIASVTATATKADGKATLTVDSGIEKSLSVGENKIAITVTAEDGKTAKTYAVTITRQEAPAVKSADATLSALTASAGTLSPSFTPETTAYTVSVPNETDKITVTATKTSEKATLTGDSGIEKSLSVGENKITITVTAEDGATTKSYTVTVTRAAIAAITLAAIPGVIAPVAGATPVTTITDTAQYSGTVAWSPSVTSAFAASTAYTAKITLVAKAGFTLTGVAANLFTVAGATSVSNAVDSGVVTAIFPATGTVTETASPITMKRVPSGSYQRDSIATNKSVITKDFNLSETEVTRAQYAKVMGSDPSNTAYSSGVNDPVQMVTWFDAVEFCNALSAAEGFASVYTITGRTPATGHPITDATVTSDFTKNGYRLPTQMEWKWAAMGATSDRSNGYAGTGLNTTGYLKGYAGSVETGKAIVNIGNYAVFGYYVSDVGRTTTERTNPVGGKIANELGLKDMGGNVSEWCYDFYEDTYAKGMLSDYVGPALGTDRVILGGDWSFGTKNCAIGGVTVLSDPYNMFNRLGFRVARNADFP